jgi:DNA-binding CsgD family transcriptional regulator
VAAAHLCNATGRPAEALTLWAACPPAGWDESAADAPVDLLRQAREALGPGQARAAEQRGAAMSLVTAAEYALLLTAPAAEVAPAGPGLGSLSPRERELVTLVAQGRTDAQIAAQLYISVRTVHTHLDRIRDKTGCRRRADLTRLALQAGLI